MKSRLTLLNGVWSVDQDLQAEITRLGLRRHLVVADEARYKPEELARQIVILTHILTVIEEMENRIRVVVQRI